MAKASVRDRNTAATRARIGETALELFTSQGYAETTIDQIAAAAGVGRRTVFRHFATKEALLFDHLVAQREVTIQRLRDRPWSEAPLVSLHAVLREMCEAGYDGRLLAQIRLVLAAEPTRTGDELWEGVRTFEMEVIAALQYRCGGQPPSLAIHAVTKMAFGWFVTAARLYLVEGRRSLVETFDEIVATCVQSIARDLA